MARGKDKRETPPRDQAPSFDEIASILVRLDPGDAAALEELRDALEARLGEGDRDPVRSAELCKARDLLTTLIGSGPEADSAVVLERVGEALERALSNLPGRAAEQDAAVAAGADTSTSTFELVPEGAETEILGDFLIESRELLEASESAMLALESNPEDRQSIDTVFRAFHTIKGTAACLGLPGISDFAHRAENLLSRVRDGEIRFTGGYAQLALHSVDALKQMSDGIQVILGGGTAGPPPITGAMLVALGDPETAGFTADRTGEIAGAAAGPSDESATPASEGRAETVRVQTTRLDKLVDVVGELVVAHSMLAQQAATSSESGIEMQRRVGQTTKIIRELQDLSLAMRMVPLSGMFRKIVRVVRDLAAKSGKSVRLIASGEETEIDRNMVDLVGDPLVHMVRNAIDHGIEPGAERRAAGKPAEGVVRLSAFHQGGAVVLCLEDDGRGLDRSRILDKAIRNGLIADRDGLSDEEVFALIFAPGFSTVEQVTEISGRGVGMDVVRTAIDDLKGRIDISSTPGSGTRFTLRLPLTLAIADGMQVRVAERRFIIPTTSISMSFRPTTESLVRVAGSGQMVRLRDLLLPVFRLDRLFGIAGGVESPEHGLLVVIDDPQEPYALLVDELLSQQQVVVKSFDSGLGKLPGVSGAAILGDGTVGLILEATELAALGRGRPRRAGHNDTPGAASAAPRAGRCP